MGAQVPEEGTARIRQWRRAAVAMALLFASLPLAGKLFLGSWRFDGALDLAGLCLVAAAYLYFAGGETKPPVPDSSAVLDEALRLAGSGQTGLALALLEDWLRLNPDLWQAWQYRAEIHMSLPGGAETARKEVTEAIRLAPSEAHLYNLRGHIWTLLEDHAAARADWDTAARLSAVEPITAVILERASDDNQ